MVALSPAASSVATDEQKENVKGVVPSRSDSADLSGLSEMLHCGGSVGDLSARNQPLVGRCAVQQARPVRASFTEAGWESVSEQIPEAKVVRALDLPAHNQMLQYLLLIQHPLPVVGSDRVPCTCDLPVPLRLPT